MTTGALEVRRCMPGIAGNVQLWQESGATGSVDVQRSAAQRMATLGVLVVVSFAAGGLGSLLQGDTAQVQATYNAFVLPSWAPPTQAFGIVWPALYLLIGVAAWRVVDKAGGVRHAQAAVSIWAAQLAVNAVWPWVFFGADGLGTAVVVIVVLDILVVATIASFRRHDPVAGWLLVPYLAWLLFATALNIAVWQLN